MSFKYIQFCDSCGVESEALTESIRSPENWLGVTVKRFTPRGSSEKYWTACERMSCAFKIVEKSEQEEKEDETHSYEIRRMRYIKH